MPRPILAAVAAFLVVIPQSQAQVAPSDSATRALTGGPVATFGLPPLVSPRLAVLAPGGRFGPHLPPAVVAQRWAAAVRAGLRGIVLNPWTVDTSVAARVAAAAAAAAAPRPTGRIGPQSPLGPYADLGMQLNLRFELKADQFRNLRCSPQEAQLTISGCHPGFPTISPDPQYSIRAAGVVGRRLHLNVDFDSQREFDANNNLQIWYEGLEDEMLRRVEAGNVSFQAPPSRFISAAIPANNFGLQAIGQIGALELRGIYAQQKGNVIRDRSYTVGETTTQPLDREARDLDYAAGRFFFAVDPSVLPGYPGIDVLAIDPVTIPDSLRVGSLRVYRVRVAAPGAVSNQNIGGVRAVACAPTANAPGCAQQRAGPFQWEVLQEGRDYYVDESGSWFALASPLNEDDYLAVSYVPAGQAACGAPRSCIGTFPIVGNPDTSVVDTLRLVYDPKPGITAGAPSFRFELRNAYRVGGSEVTRETVELLLTVNQRERSVSTGETYLAVLGVAAPNDPNRFDQYNRLFPRGRDPLQGAPVRDFFIIFPHLTPFADSTRLTAAERNDSLYRTPRRLLGTQGPPSVFTVALRANVSASADRAALSLNSFEIREGSEKIYVRNTLLQRGRDYTIDYTTGQVQFIQADSLFGSGVAQVRAQFEERAAFAIAPTSIYGLAGRYDLGERGTVNVMGLFQRENSAFTRPPLGFEPSSSFIGGINADLRFQPAWLTRAADALPGVRTDAPSFLNVAGEVAVSRPSPNRFGQAYLEEFEAEAGRFLSLAENAWRWGSTPSSSRGAEPFGVSPFGFDPFDAAALTWQSVPYNPDGRPVQFLPQQIDPTIRVTGATQNAEPVLWLMLKPDTVLGTASSRTGEPNWVRPAQFGPRWRSLTQPLSAGGLDLSRIEFLEFWVWEDNHRIAKNDRVALVIDVGSVFEDALAWVPDSFTVAGGDTTYYGQRFVGQGRLDTERDPVTRSWNAAVSDEGFLTDRVVDGIRDAGSGLVVDTLPLCSASDHGQIIPFGFGDLRSRCGRRNGFVDTEDQDGDFALDSAAGVRRQEDFVRFVFPIGDDRFFVREGGMIPVRDSLGNPDGAAGWRLYRIPFRTDTIQVGIPNLRQAQAVRLTLVAPQLGSVIDPDPQVYFGLSRVRLVGSTWLKRGETPLAGLAGNRGTFSGEVAASVVSTENTDLGYTPPPGVTDQASRQDAGLQIGSQQINEKSLRLLARGLEVGERAEAYLRFTSEGDKNFLRYKTLRAWARGRGPGWEDGDLAFFVKAGKDENNFYYYQTPAHTATWEPEVVVDLQRWLILRARIEQAWLGGQPPQAYAGCPDSTFLPPQDSAYVMCDGGYVVYVRNPSTSPPNLAQVQELAVGMVRLSQRVFIDEAELWVDDIRLGDVVEDIGIAGALDVSLSAGGVADLALSVSRRDGQFRQLGEDPSYVTDNALSVGGTVRLEQFLPDRWGLAIPVSARVARTSADPFYLNRSDIRADVLDGLRAPSSRAENYGVSIRRIRRSSGGLGRWLLDPTALSGSYTRGSSQSSYATATSSGYAVNLDYVVTPTAGGVTVAGQRLRLTPTSVRFRTGLAANDADRSTFQVPVVRPGDSTITPARSTVRTWRTSTGFDLLPFTGFQLRADGNWLRDLRDYGDSSTMGRVIRQQRASLLGLDAGFETQRSITTFIGLTPQVAPWLRPRATLSSSFLLNRDPNAAAPVRTSSDSTGEFRIPTAFSNNRQADLGAQLDLRALSRGLWGDSARVVALLARLQPVDVSFTRRLGSNFSRTGLAPSIGYQLALGGLDAFRSLDGVPATSANDNTTFAVRGGTGLPLGFRFGTDYLRTRGESWLLRTGTQVPIRTLGRTWPSATLSWAFTPRRQLQRVLTNVSAQGGYREVQTVSAQPVASGGSGGSGSATSTSTSVDRTFSRSLTVSWRGGVLTSLDGSATRSNLVQSGTAYKTARDQHNATLSFAFRPWFVKMRSPMRTSARYSVTANTQCIRTAGQTECVRYVDSKQRSAQLTMDTDFQSNLGAGLSVTYVLNDERQVGRKTSQLVITAFVSFTTTVGRIQ